MCKNTVTFTGESFYFSTVLWLWKWFLFYLEPGEEDNDGSHVVELDLQIGQRLKTGVRSVILQQSFEPTADHGCSGYVH